MILCVGGDIHGAIDQFYADVLAFEKSLEVRFDRLSEITQKTLHRVILIV